MNHLVEHSCAATFALQAIPVVKMQHRTMSQLVDHFICKHFCFAGNPALKMQHWMKNQLVKESYADKWEDIVRSGNMDKAAHLFGESSQTRLPAEFGTKDKVPARGTAPMGLSDYKDGSQWADRNDVLGHQGTHDLTSHPEEPEYPKGYLGGDGALRDQQDEALSCHIQQQPRTDQPLAPGSANSEGASWSQGSSSGLSSKQREPAAAERDSVHPKNECPPSKSNGAGLTGHTAGPAAGPQQHDGAKSVAGWWKSFQSAAEDMMHSNDAASRDGVSDGGSQAKVDAQASTSEGATSDTIADGPSTSQRNGNDGTPGTSAQVRHCSLLNQLCLLRNLLW